MIENLLDKREQNFSSAFSALVTEGNLAAGRFNVWRRNRRNCALVILCLLLLAACGGGSSAGDPAQTVEKYLTAKVSGDGDTVRALLCSAMEADKDREASAFSSVTGAKIEDMDCRRDGDTDFVICAGKIVADYGTEVTDFPLSSYKVVQEDGDWKWCGESAAP